MKKIIYAFFLGIFSVWVSFAYGQNGKQGIWDCGELKFIPYADGTADIIVFDKKIKGVHDTSDFEKVFIWDTDGRLQLFIKPSGLAKLYDFTNVPSGGKAYPKMRLYCFKRTIPMRPSI